MDAYILGKLSKKFLFDFDDAIYLKHEKYNKEKSFSTNLKFNSIIKNASLIVAGNRILAEYVSPINSNIKIVPSTVETKGVPVRDYDKENEKFTVGWVGGNINLTQLQLLSDVFRRLSGEIPLELRVISGEKPEITGIDMRFIQWTEDGEANEIAKLDAGVMPLPDSPHARGKCAFKAIQYMAAGVVPVVSDVGINAEVVQNNKSGLVAKNIDDFYDHLKYLYNNKGQMKEMGAKARERAVQHYSLDSAADALDEIFKAL